MPGPIDFTDLQVFRVVVEEGGIIKASRKLHRVPSNVTKRIKQLETSMGVTLFHRDRQRLHLSPTGELLRAMRTSCSSYPKRRAPPSRVRTR
jgi:DNA-binding transcriptional LysR family regulator